MRTFRKLASLFLALCLTAALPVQALAATYDIGAGSVIITSSGDSSTQTVSHGGVDMGVDAAPVITGSSTSHTVTLTGGGEVKVTLQDASISASKAPMTVEGSTKAEITLSGENTAKNNGFGSAGVSVGENASLSIEGGEGDSLTATGGFFGAGIGSGMDADCGTITINGGTVDATGGKLSAGIGAGADGNGGTVVINGGNVTAKGDNGSAGIGGGSGYGGDTTINGGTVDATGGVRGGAGIGSGLYGEGGTVTINGGTVTAKGGEGSTVSSDSGGAGIGNGNESCGVTVTIKAGEVMAVGGVGASGIGVGCKGEAGDISIQGGIVNATGGSSYSDTVGSGAGIGGGTVSISGGNITAAAGENKENYTGPATESISGDLIHTGGTISKPGDKPEQKPALPETQAPIPVTPEAVKELVSLVESSDDEKDGSVPVVLFEPQKEAVARNVVALVEEIAELKLDYTVESNAVTHGDMAKMLAFVLKEKGFAVHEEEQETIREYGLMDGLSADQQFHEEERLTKAQMVVVLARLMELLGIPVDDMPLYQQFQDVTSDDWFYKDLLTLLSLKK